MGWLLAWIISGVVIGNLVGSAVLHPILYGLLISGIFIVPLALCNGAVSRILNALLGPKR